MIYYAAVPLTVAVVVLQIAAAPGFRYAGVHPDLPVVWLGCWAAIRGRDEMLPLLLIAGTGLGLLGPEPLGASLLGLLPLAGLATLQEFRTFRNGFLLAVGGVLVGGVAFVLIEAAAAYAGGQPLGGFFNVLRVAPRVGVLDALTAAAWYWPLRLAIGRRRRGGVFRRT